MLFYKLKKHAPKILMRIIDFEFISRHSVQGGGVKFNN